MAQLSAQDQAFIAQLHASNPQSSPGLSDIEIKDPETGGHYKLATGVSEAFHKANLDYKAVFGHDIPLASAYRDPARNKRVGGSPTSNHLHGQALDINRDSVAQVKPFLEAHGFKALGGTYRGKSEDNHFDFHGAGGHSSQSDSVSTNQPIQSQTSQPQVNVPEIPKGALVVPLQKELTGSVQAPPVGIDLAGIQKANRDILNSSQQPAPNYPMPTAPDLARIQQQSRELAGSGLPSVQPQQPQSGFDLGKFAGDLVGQAGDAIQKEMAPINNPIELFTTRNPFMQAGAGALSEAAHLANGITQLPADIGNAVTGKNQFESAVPKIPTGALDDFTANSPILSSVGRLAPYALGEGLAGAGLKALPFTARAMEAANATGLGRVLTGAGINALEGGLVDPGEGGLQQRGINAALGGGLGGLLHGGMEGLNSLIAKRFPGQSLDNITPAEVEQLQSLMRSEEATANPQELNQSFNNRVDMAGDQAVDQLRQNLTIPKRPDMSGELVIPGKSNSETGDIVSASSLPQGRDLAYPDPIQPVKSAQESASIFKDYYGNEKTANDLFMEAQQNRSNLEAQMLSVTGSNDSIEAQRLLGQRINELEAKGNNISSSEFDELAQKQSLIQDVIAARKQELDASSLLADESKLTPRSSIEMSEQPNQGNRIKTAAELAMERQPLEEQKRLGSREMSQTKQKINSETVSLLDPSGRPLVKQEMSGNVIDFPGKPAGTGKVELAGPNGELLDLASMKPKQDLLGAVEPQAKTITTSKGGEVFAQGRTPERVQSIAQGIEGSGLRQLLNLGEAHRLIKQLEQAGVLTTEKADGMLTHLQNFAEAGRTGKTFDYVYNQLQRGRGAIEGEFNKSPDSTRIDTAPFGVSVASIKPQTEVSNLIKELGSAEAAQAQLRQRAFDLGLTPTTEGRAVKGSNARSNAVKIAEQIAAHPKGQLQFKQIYLHQHNPRTSEIGKLASGIEGDTPGVVRLDTLKQSTVGAKDAIIPEGSTSQNSIRELNGIYNLAKQGTLPKELAGTFGRIEKLKKVTNTDLKRVRELINSDDSSILKQFCSIIGLQ